MESLVHVGEAVPVVVVMDIEGEVGVEDGEEGAEAIGQGITIKIMSTFLVVKNKGGFLDEEEANLEQEEEAAIGEIMSTVTDHSLTDK